MQKEKSISGSQYAIPKEIPISRVSQPQDYRHFGPDNSFVVRAALCVKRMFSSIDDCCVLVANSTHPSVVTMSLDMAKCPSLLPAPRGRGRNHPIENHCQKGKNKCSDNFLSSSQTILIS